MIFNTTFFKNNTLSLSLKNKFVSFKRFVSYKQVYTKYGNLNLKLDCKIINQNIIEFLVFFRYYQEFNANLLANIFVHVLNNKATKLLGNNLKILILLNNKDTVIPLNVSLLVNPSSLDLFVDYFLKSYNQLTQKPYFNLESLNVIYIKVFRVYDLIQMNFHLQKRNMTFLIKPKLKSTKLIIRTSSSLLIIKTMIFNNQILISSLIYYSNNQFYFFFIKDYSETDFVLANTKLILDFLNLLKYSNFLNKKNFIYIHTKSNILILLLPYFFQIDPNLKILMDKENNIIQVQFCHFIIRNSYRILPVNLLDLGQLVNSHWFQLNKNWLFSNTQLLNKNECQAYLVITMYLYLDVMNYYSLWLYENYNSNFTRFYSTSQLAFTLFQTYYLKQDIPILTQTMYNKIIPSYYGGLLHHFSNEIEQGYYYDVNSLYPYSMLKKMPGQFVEKISNKSTDYYLSNEIFGFYYCSIYLDPKKELKPILPFKDKNNKLIWKSGYFEGLYFSKEIENAVNYGYVVRIHFVLKFSELENVFTDYINSIYELKLNSKNENERLIYKMMLNGLYGYLSRNPTQLIDEIVSTNDLPFYFSVYEISNYFQINENYYYLKRNNKMKTGFLSDWENNPVKSNIAISSAITSYSRIYMSQFFTEDLVYSDTDSLILKKELNSKYIGSSIGLFKLVDKIEKGYFLSPKTYAYKNDKNEVKIKSAGIPSNFLNFDDFENLVKNPNFSKTVKFPIIVKNYPDFSLSLQEKELVLNFNFLDKN